MESEGPYTTGLSEGLVFKDNMVVESFDSERDKLNACRLANAAHAEGRKAERERCLEIARGYSSCEGIAQKIAKEIEEVQDGK